MWLLSTLALAAPCDSADTCRSACDGGDLGACVDLGDALLDSQPGEARALYARVCPDVATGKACDRLGVALAMSDDPAEIAQGITLLVATCDAGSSLACRNLGICVASGVGGPADPKRAAAVYASACNGLGDGPSCHNLALLKLGDLLGAPDPVGAATDDRRGCELGFPGSCTAYGLYLATGTGVAVDLGAATDLLGPLCDAGDPIACRQLGVLLQDGLAPQDDHLRAFGALDRACRAGDPLGCAYRGMLYEEGVGTAMDLGAAALDYAAACDAGLDYGCARAAALDLPTRRSRALQRLRELCLAGDTWSCAAVQGASSPR